MEAVREQLPGHRMQWFAAAATTCCADQLELALPFDATDGATPSSTATAPL
jgi:hypothetical protein